MALPVPQDVGPSDAGQGAVSPAWPTHTTGDIALLVVTSAAQTITLSDAQGFVEVPDSPQTFGSAGGASAVRLAVFWCRATGSSMAAPTVADPGDHVIAQILTFRGCIASGDPWDVTAGDTGTAASSTSVPGDTTTVDDCLIVAISGDSFDTNLDRYSAWANADLANVAERTDVHTNQSTGSGFGVATGEKATAGAFGATTATLNGTSGTARIMVALKPPVGSSDRRAQVTWAELEVPTAPRRAIVTFAEVEVPDGPRRAVVTFAELEVPTAPRRGIVTWAELELPDAPRRAIVTFAELEVPEPPSPNRRAIVSFAELEVPDAPRRAVVTFAELEVPNAPRRSIVTWAELEVPTAPRRALVTFAELEVPDAPDPNRRAVVTWAELEIPSVPRRAVVTWAELEVPNAPDPNRRAIVTWAEFQVPDVPGQTVWLRWAWLSKSEATPHAELVRVLNRTLRELEAVIEQLHDEADALEARIEALEP